MRKKTVSMVFAGLTAIGGILPHAPKIIPEGKSLIAASAVAATLSIPAISAAAIIPARIVQIAAVSLSRNCEAGVMERLCSHVTSFLDEEADKAASDLKNCKKNCNWKKHKNDLLISAKKKAKDSCAKGQAPNANELSKGLDRNTKDRLKALYDNNSRMFDGTAKLKSVDFNAASSKDATVTSKTAVLGKGGQVTDLKSAEPATPKLNAASEFSLSGTKPTGGTSAPPKTKQSATLLTSAAELNTSPATASGLPAKSPSDTTASAQKALAASDPIIPMVRECKCYYGGLFLEVGEGGIPGSVCEAWKTKNCCPQNQTMAATGCSATCKAGTGFFGFYTNWRHDTAGATSNCGSECFNPETKCCLPGKTVGAKCGVDAVCYDPKKECCEDGKKISKSCPCYYIGKRLDVVNKRIAKYNQHLPLSQTEPTAPTIARTSCLWGNIPWTVYYPGFDALDPDVQAGIKAHENEHRQQCKNMGRRRYMELLTEKEYVLEVPAYTKERDFLEGKRAEKCK